MKRVSAPAKYDPANEQSFRNAVADADEQSVKKGQEWNAVRLVFTDTVTGSRYQLTVSSGALTLVSVP